MDATTLGSVLALFGVLAGAVVAYLGKRGETAVTAYTNLTGDLQEERDRLDRKVADLQQQVSERDARLAAQAAYRAADQEEIARLRATVIQLGGQP